MTFPQKRVTRVFPAVGAVLLAGLALTFAGNVTSAQELQDDSRLIRAFERSIERVVRRVMPSVVVIETVISRRKRTDNKRSGENERTRRGQGCGVVVDPAGYVLTNQHVIESALEIVVTLTDGTRLPATVAGSDVRSDLAVLKVQAEGLAALPVTTAARMTVGRLVLAFGAPSEYLDDSRPIVSMGMISATDRCLAQLEAQQGPEHDRYYGNLIETTHVVVKPGSSGGPLVDLEGNVIGINTAIFTVSGGYEGIGYAIPLDEANLAIVAKLTAGEEIEYGWLGIVVAAVPGGKRLQLGLKAGRGVLVDDVRAGSPAFVSGTRPGDVITRLADVEVVGPSDLIRRTGALTPGTQVELVILRSGDGGVAESLRLNAVVGRRPSVAVPSDSDAREPPTVHWRGITLTQVTEALAEEFNLPTAGGVIIMGCDESSVAWRAGVRPGQLVAAAAGNPVRTLEDFMKAVGDIGEVAGKSVTLQTSIGEVQITEN